ncbi:RNA dependent RNA polymerase-domain-containing protein [Glomus cerebriforme]|uniref:RNA-dependent RNA polymerase n=1 Tax=Glomus cerebriforme TaxID=658196 RepID=A0A397TR61_9GLOM|nr:RNA dependent RNA polymerase-domain-containing protein [Glomus cerebriforme]
MTKKEIYVKNIPNDAIANDVVEALSKYGPLSKFELKIPKDIRNDHAFFGYAEFEEEADADECLANAHYFPPECRGTTLCVLPSRGKVKEVKAKSKQKLSNGVNIATFPLSSMEIGNWGGQTLSITHTNGRRNRSDATQRFTFLSEWKYSHYYEKPTIRFSKAEEALILEGFNLPEDSLKRRVKISFRSLAENSRGIFLDTKSQEDGTISLYISLKQPPCLYRKADENIKAEKIGITLWYQEELDIWVRTVDWTGIVNVFGRCLVYRLNFRDNLDQLRHFLNDFVIRGIPRPMLQCAVICIEKSSYSRDYFDILCQVLPFKICFKLENLMSYGKLTLDEIEEELGERLVDLIYDEQEMMAWHALNQISTKHWDPFDNRYQERPLTVFDVALRNFRSRINVWYPSKPDFQLTNNSRCVWVNHATITPTRIYFDGPNYESSNRILRQYEDKTDHFLRVTFKDENFDRLFVNKNESADIINLRIVAIINAGLCLAGRHYEFLAFSSSQLKETSCWFVASNGEFNANFIRANMGDFSKIQAPSLYAARMGQCFTSTVGTLKLDQHQKINILDIERNDYKFSDGCGKISESLAKRAAKRYWGKKPKDKEIPSVFQFRYGGCKGVVAVDPSLEGDVLCIRPSQEKFEAPSSILEIVKTVKNPLPGHLNRQIILLLSTLGVQNEVFIELQNEMRTDIDSMMIDEVKACGIVKRNIGTRECSHVMRTILSMIDAGMMRGTVDPFLKALLECKRVFALKSLRYKARILMPKSFLLLGVIDETGILEEDEIYIQTSTIVSEHHTFDTAYNKVQREHKVWTGPAIITRNPCLHPGDIRMAHAVDASNKLSHLRNCIVFSQKGDRPLPNLLSGGDLDGDEFFVCFDERIFIIENEEPMDYDATDKKIIEDRPVEIADICEFFKDFMLNNRLGQIGNLHLALADYSVEGVRSKKCIELAELHSKAVDFNKTGVPVDDILPTIDKYPDFMEHKFKESYKSDKILGILYRNIKLDKPNSDPLLKYYVKNITPNEDFLFDGYQDYVEEAIVFRDYYNGEIRNLMKKYRVKTEAEILTSHLLGYKRIDGRKCQDIREAIAGTVSYIIHNCRKQFLMGLNQNTNENINADDITPFNLHTTIQVNDESKAKASAWYYVTYNQEEFPDRGGKTCLLSFPWVVADVLLAIRMENHLEKMNNLIRDIDFSLLERLY